MSLENISQAVLETARKEADLILAKGRKGAESRLASARQQVEQDCERRFQIAARAIDEECARELVQLKGAANKEALAKRNEILCRVFDAAREQILALPLPEYAIIMGKWLEHATEGHGGMIRTYPAEYGLFAQILAVLNKTRTPDTAIMLDDSAPLETRGGFIFVAKSFQVDQTLDAILSEIEKDLAPEIARSLFAAP